MNMGIIGSGQIAHRFVPEAKTQNNLNITAVYNPRIESAETFAKKHELPIYTDDLPAFLAEVQGVYIASPHQTHYEYARLALEAGVCVLCEKPMALKEAHARELFALAKEKNLVLMEAVKTAYLPGFAALLKAVRAGRIGRVVDVEASFARLETRRRLLKEGEIDGAFIDLASYPLFAILKILGSDFADVRFVRFVDAGGFDVYTKAYLTYKDALATAKVGKSVKSDGQLIVSGIKGCIIAKDPWWRTQCFEIRYDDESKNEIHHAECLGSGLGYEAGVFASLVKDKQGVHTMKDTPAKTASEDFASDAYLTSEESIALAKIMEQNLETAESKNF